MTGNNRAAIAALGVLVALAACKSQNQSAQGERQVELAPSPAAQPQLADTSRGSAAAVARATPEAPRVQSKTRSRAPAPVAAAPQATAPSPVDAPSSASPGVTVTPPVMASATGIIPGGTTMTAVVSGRICTNTYAVGDRVTATLASGIPGTNGSKIPQGTAINLRVTESQRGENGKEGVRLSLEPVSVAFGGATYPITGTASTGNIEMVRVQTNGDQAKKVAVGAVIGAIAGKLFGKKNSTAVVGAAVGAAAGGAVAAGSADWNGCLGDGGRVSVTLAGPLSVRVVP